MQVKGGDSMTEKEKALDKKVKRFDKWLMGILLNIAISMLTTLLLLEKLGLH